MGYFGIIEVFVPFAQVFFAGAGIEDEESKENDNAELQILSTEEGKPPVRGMLILF